MNFARNISRKRWGGEEQNPSPRKEKKKKKTNKRNFKFPNRLSQLILANDLIGFLEIIFKAVFLASLGLG